MENNTIVTDIKMPFWSMVTFMVRWAIATIPAMLILWWFFAFGVTVLKALFFG